MRARGGDLRAALQRLWSRHFGFVAVCFALPLLARLYALRIPDMVLHDLEHISPALVFDTMRSGYFFKTIIDDLIPAWRLSNFPELAGFVGRGYERVRIRHECPSLYLRRDLAAPWYRNEIVLVSDVPALVDGSTTEGCHDWCAPAAGAKKSFHCVHYNRKKLPKSGYCRPAQVWNAHA